jgi:hypothetical protein
MNVLCNLKNRQKGDTKHYLSFFEKGIIPFYIPDDENELTNGIEIKKDNKRQGSCRVSLDI